MLDMSKSGDWKTSVRSGGNKSWETPLSVREIGKNSVSRSNRSRECNWLVNAFTDYRVMGDPGAT